MNRKLLGFTFLFVGMVLPLRATLDFTSATNVPPISASLNGIAYGGDSSLVAVGSNSVTSSARFTNGLSVLLWSSNSVPSSTNLHIKAVTRGNGMFVIGGQNASIFSSPDGVQWNTNRNAFANSATVEGLAFNSTAGRFAAVGSIFVIASADAALANWTNAALTSPTPSLLESYRDVTAFGANSFAACGIRGTIRISQDGGRTWTAGANGMPGRRFDINEPNLFGIASGDGQLVAVGAAGTILVSSDGGTIWNTITNPISGTTNSLNGVAYTGSGFIAAGDAGVILITTNSAATNWTAIASPTNSNFLGVSFATEGQLRGLAVIVGANGTIVVGAEHPSAPSNPTNGVVCSGGSETNLCVTINTNGFPLGTLVMDWYRVLGPTESNLVSTIPITQSNICFPVTNTIALGTNLPASFTFFAKSRDLRTGYVSPNTQEATLTIFPLPVSTNVAKTICSRDTVAVPLQPAVSNGVISTFSWRAALNTNVTGASTTAVGTSTISDLLTNVTDLPQMVIYTVTPTSTNGCLGDDFTVTVTVNPHPVATNILKTICSRDAVAVLLQPAVSNGVLSTFSWRAAANPNVTGESTTAVGSGTISDLLTNVTDLPQVVIYTVTPTSTSGCLGDDFTVTVTVTVNPHPVATNVLKTICSRDTVAVPLQPAVANGVLSTFSWRAAANPNVTGESTTAVGSGTISDLLTNVTDLPQVVIYTVTPTSTSGCLGDDFTVTVTVNPHPVATNVLNTICSQDAVAVLLQPAIANGVLSTFSWRAALNTNVTGASLTAVGTSTITDSLINISALPQVVTYTVTPTSTNGCLGDDFTVTVTVNPQPTLLSGGDQTVCVGIANPPLSVNVSEGIIVDWFTNATGGSPLIIGTNTFTPSATAAGIYTYYAEARDPLTSCSSGRIPVTLTILDCPLMITVIETNAILQWYGNLQLQSTPALADPTSATVWSFVKDGTVGETNRWTNSISGEATLFRVRSP